MSMSAFIFHTCTCTVVRIKSNVAMNAWLPQASYPCGNFSDTNSIDIVYHDDDE